MLALMLALSTGTRPDYLPHKRRNYEGLGKDLWSSIMAEEPLDGDHWKQWSNDDDEDEMMSVDTEDFVLDQEHYTRYRNTREASASASAELQSSVKSAIQDRIELEDIQPFDLQALHKRQYWEEGTEDHQYISEADAIREVLFMLQGYSSVLFKQSNQITLSQSINNKQYEVNPQSLKLKHLSHNAFVGILSELCNYGNMIYNLREWCNKIIHETSGIKFGQTCTAFAICVTKLLQDFELSISDIEVNYCKGENEEDQPVISLLQLKETLATPIQAIRDIYELVIDSPINDLDRASSTITPRRITTQLVNGLYSGIVNAQLTGNNHVYDTLLFIFRETIKPFGRMLDDWISRASLQGDSCQEFFISRNRNESIINDQTADFWSNGYHAHSNNRDGESYNRRLYVCPLFDQAFLRRTMFVGKAVIILSKFGVKTNNNESFQECLRSVIAEPKPVVAVNNISNNKTTAISSSTVKKPESNLSRMKNPFLRAGLPLLFASEQQHVPERETHHQHSSGDDGHDDDNNNNKDGIDEVPFLFDQSLTRCLDKYLTYPYQQATGHLNGALRSHGLLNECLVAIASIYLMLDTNLMHVFCESLFSEMDINNPLTQDAIDKLFMDAKLTVEWNLPGSSTSYLKFEQQLDFLSQIRFEYHIPWPINNFIKESTLTQYSTIVTFLLQLKRAKYLLDRKMIFQHDRRNMRLYPMRMKLIWFVNAFWSYVMTTILHTETIRFRKAVDDAVDADEIAQLHNDYVSKIVDRCLLGDKTQSVHKAVLKIVNVVPELAHLFANNDDNDSQNFGSMVDEMQKTFDRSNEFIATTLKIVGRKGGFPWFEALAASLSYSES
ncbi:Spc98 family-domain-containing protein [Zychaea mexicana]|uniref:Spc98 family-domain-containing protein n=1 Tax=Zychaea mexicana TaxID=64656 RepID=UPI0022FDD4EA|nr:Spc98 family-domain-containing protein [Zychaea mexicana]KAI9496943.1 Spc98 family-domain-containing protein [Zychaea mexicana]